MRLNNINIPGRREAYNFVSVKCLARIQDKDPECLNLESSPGGGVCGGGVLPHDGDAHVRGMGMAQALFDP